MIPDEIPQARGSVFGDNSGSMLVSAKDQQHESLFDTPRDGGKTFAQRRDEFVASAGKQIVRDRETAGAAADTIKLANEVWALVDADRRARSDPFRETHLALSGMAAEFWEPVNQAMAGLREQIDAYTAEEDARIAAQQAEQQEALARMRGAASPPPAPPQGRSHIDYSVPTPEPQRIAPAMRAPRRSRIRGDLGSTISQRDVVEYEIEDISLIPEHILTSETVKAAILAVVRATARHMGVPKGIRVITGTGNQIR